MKVLPLVGTRSEAIKRAPQVNSLGNTSLERIVRETCPAVCRGMVLSHDLYGDRRALKRFSWIFAQKVG